MELVAVNGLLTGPAYLLSQGLMTRPRTTSRPPANSAAAFGRWTAESSPSRPPTARRRCWSTACRSQGGRCAPATKSGLGDSLFIAREHERAPATVLDGCQVSLGRLARTRQVLEVPFDDAVLYADDVHELRAGHDLAKLTRAVGALTSVRGLAAIDSALAGFILGVVQAERVAFIDCHGTALTTRSAWSSAGSTALEVDAEIVKRACERRTAVIVRAPGGRRVLAVRMIAFGRATGAAWVEAAAEGAAALDQGHLRLLLVITALAAVAREESREAARLQESKERLQAEINLDHSLVGRSAAMRAVYELMARVATSDATVLILGESGTGKELVARAVHRTARAPAGRSSRSTARRSPRTCSRASSSATSRAPSPARSAKNGARGAHGGTLFLDEIGEMPLGLQANLLRVLQEREFERVGGTRPIGRRPAGRRDQPGPRRGGQRRLPPGSLLPPQRRHPDHAAAARPEGGSPAAGRAFRAHARGAVRRRLDATCDAGPARYDWPGNVRELENTIERAVVLGCSDHLMPEDLPPGLWSRQPPDMSAPVPRGGQGSENMCSPERSRGTPELHGGRTPARPPPQLPPPRDPESRPARAHRHAVRPRVRGLAGSTDRDRPGVKDRPPPSGD